MAEQRTEHAARLVDPAEFRADAFRRKTLSPGVVLIIGKRPRARKTEAQALRFDVEQFTPAAAREWAERHGFRVQSWGYANPCGTENPDGDRLPSAPMKAIDDAGHQLVRVASFLQNEVYPASDADRKRYVEASVALVEAASFAVRASGLREPRTMTQGAGFKIDVAMRHVPELAPRRAANPDAPERVEIPHPAVAIAVATSADLPPMEDSDDQVENPADPFWQQAGVRELQRRRRHGAEWTTRTGQRILTETREPDFAKFKRDLAARVERAGGRIVRWHPYRSNPEAPNEPDDNPRELVQIANARELTLADGMVYKWTVAERWPLLTLPGAERLPPGRGRLFLVSPSGATRPEAAGERPRAARTFETWTARPPRREFDLDVPAADEFTPIGHAVNIVYRSDKWGRPNTDWTHPFKKSNPPQVGVVGTQAQPRAVTVYGGAFRVTNRGLVD